ncbi:MAG TPA: 6-phosphogluconolactonase [Candidatus Krumholzibacteria bacterium]|nr:6-phosphogluconolactonase [Candidatus Krumholzibacteria bacterium]
MNALSGTRGVLRTFTDPGALAAGAADAMVQVARQQERFRLALSGGHTPVDLYRTLASSEYRTQLDWNRVDVFFSDERAVAPDSVRSNYRTAHQTLLGPLGVPARNIHRMEGERGDLLQAVDDYADAIASCFGITAHDDPPRFDLVLLGLGEDGHVASLFPGSPALAITDRWIAANTSPEGEQRITMTLPLINRARAVFFLVAGREKADVLERVWRDSADSVRLPAQEVHLEEARPVWFVDREAAARLRVR